MTPLFKSNIDDEHWTMIIRPKRRWLDPKLGELWRYHDLITLFVWRDFVAAHKQTILGPLLHLVGWLMCFVCFCSSLFTRHCF
jgi:lipopolysaccharide transport system permease protein